MKMPKNLRSVDLECKKERDATFLKNLKASNYYNTYTNKYITH